MDYQKFSKALAVALASDSRTHRLLNPSIIPAISSVVIDTLAEFEGKTKVTLPSPAANPQETVEAVTHKPPVFGEEIPGTPPTVATTPTPAPTVQPTEAAPEPKPAATEVGEKREFVDFFSMTKQQALDWYRDNKDARELDIEGISTMNSGQVKRTLNKVVNEE